METMDAAACHALLAGARFGHLGLARAGAAYVVPLSFGFDGRAIYMHGHPGMKDEYVATTREACFVVTRVGADDSWESVLAYGPVEEMVLADDRLKAMQALMGAPPPPLLGSTPRGEPRRSDDNVRFWRLRPTRITGRRSSAPVAEAFSAQGPAARR